MIHGRKLLLRPFRIEDLERLHAYVNDMEVALPAAMSPKPLAATLVQPGREAAVAGYAADAIVFAIEAANRFIGTCAIQQFDPVAHSCEIRIVIGDRAFWNRGFGREALGMLIDYAFRQFNVNRIWLSVLSNNLRAFHCFAACQFVEEGRLRQHIWNDGAYIDLVYMGLLHSDWHASQIVEAVEEPEAVAA